MKARLSTGQDLATNQAWEVINDLAIYQTCKSFLDPMSDDIQPTPAHDTTSSTQTFRAVVINVEAGHAPRCTEQVGILVPYGCECDQMTGDHGLIGRVFSPVTRAFQRVLHGNH